jgi:myo-inositol-1(or 4)-monophosphatase
MEKQPTLTELEEIARGAGEILLSYQNRDLQIAHKGRINLVTDADKAAEKFILSRINQNFPDHRIIAEESGIHDNRSPFSWYIDPLDGTGNYAHGIPIYSVSIGITINDELQLGIVFDPTRNECYTTERGKGAWLNGIRIQVSTADFLENAMLVTGFPYDITTTKRDNLDNYARLSKLSRGVRRLGSAALDLAYVACGRLDGYWELDLHPYDVAAGALLVREAGGVVTTTEGSLKFMDDEHASILVGNPIIHGQLLGVL